MLMKSLLGALAALPMVYASLYPTFPTQESVIPAGQDVVIRWKDDSHSPHLDKLGLLRVDLFLDNDANLVSTLAEGIKPTDEAAKIRIEKDFGADGSNYYIRFTPAQKGRTPIYTAKFTITGLTGSPNYRQDKPSHKNSKASDEKVNELDVKNVSNSTSTTSLSSTLASTPGITAMPTTTYTPPNLTWNTPPGAQETATLRPNYNGGSARFQRPADAGLGMMSLMYLMWPLLMGVAMAV
ncbi:hypothetical protein FRC04_003127 [Tulasnella sp. 424]|nr:hypothetical protein FRC04_003127 [Tulasnella sp. 424]KAG8967522.1 hypothetical protein FRC05_002034 [Tulasnella sp. 425]